MIKQVIETISDFQKKSDINFSNIPLPIDNTLVLSIGKYIHLKDTTVRIKDIRTSTRILYGYLRFYSNKIDIGVNDNLNNCWNRFVTCKELSHLLLGTQNNGITKDPKVLINGLYMKLAFGSSDDLDHEHLAVLCASELMMPFQKSQLLLKDKNITSIEIAKKFLLPLYIVQVYRDQNFLENRQDIYNSL